MAWVGSLPEQEAAVETHGGRSHPDGAPVPS